MHLRVGELRQVVPEALEYAWTFVVRSTPLDGSTLRLDHVPAVLTCDDCHRVAPPRPYSPRCPHCDGALAITYRDTATDRARFENSVLNGKNQMPPWKGVISPDQIELLWHFIRAKANQK